MITGPLKQQVDKLWDTFWTGGISDPLGVVEQISYLLFSKRLDDAQLARESKARMLGHVPDSPVFSAANQDLRWSQWKHLPPREMLDLVADRAFPFLKTLGSGGSASAYARHMADAEFRIKKPQLLADAVAQIDAMPMQDRDTKGDVYEYMLSKLSTAGVNGQFRTPRHIIRMMVDLMQPRPDDVVCDPACGTAGFLVAVTDWLREHRPETQVDEKMRQHLNAGMLHGYDFDTTMLRIASMNLMTHGIDEPDVAYRDSLAEDQGEVRDRYTLVLANPPFKGSIDAGSVAKNLSAVVKTKKTELLFLVQILRALQPGGRAAVIVPDGVLFGSSTAHVAVRKLLCDSHRLQGVVSLPAGVFRPYAGVSTAILLFTKTGTGGTGDVWFYDMTADGFSLDDKRQPVAQDDIPDVLAAFRAGGGPRDDGRKGRSFLVPVTEIRAQGYDLTVNRHKEVEHAAVAHEDPKVILQRLRVLDAEVTKGVERLWGML
jgi:type I restriction enzyme M protein